MKADIVTLPNKLHVVLVDTKAFPTQTTILLVGAGSRYENKLNNGVAHFFEHMAFKGSKKYPNSFVISSTIESLGGYFNAFTSKDHTGYWIKGTNEHFSTIIDVIADMVLNPLLIDEEIEREKGVIVEEINLYEDTPYRKIGELFEEVLYRGNPLGYDIAGTKDTVTKFTRKTFVDYIAQLYHPKNAVLVVAGGFSKALDYKAIIEEKFQGWKNGKRGMFEKVQENQTKPQVLIKHKKTEQTHFGLGFRAYPFSDKRKYAASLLAAILGGGMSSRLFIEVRERRGLCYYISTNREAYEDVGNFVTHAGVTNNLTKTKEAIQVILKEHSKVAAGDITKEEFIKAKELIKGRTLLSLEDSYNVSTFFGTKLLLEGEIVSPAQMIGEVEKVSLDAVVSVAQDLFKPEKLNFAVIGPLEEGEITEADLKL
ncbi:insulinase family protein [Candidatus Roizmanbacteria bacterium]|nr:insulinase family protein [Candidatus Roizmanbacteria bacterium]